MHDVGPEFNLSKHWLKPVHCRVLAGLVYVCLAEHTPDFEAFAALARPYLAVNDLTHAKVAHESSSVENGNWKIVWENNRECYHCGGNHAGFRRSYPDNPTVAGIEESETPAHLQAHFI